MRLCRLLAVCAVLALAAVPAASGGRLAPADRRAIDRTLDRFVLTAVARHRVADAYGLVTPAMRAGTTRADWARGDIPVYPIAPRGRRFHDWMLLEASHGDVLLDLFVQPRRRNSDVGGIEFRIDMKRRAGRWLVDSIYPAAIFPPAGRDRGDLHAANDFSARGGGSIDAPARLGTVWALAALAPLSLVVGIPLALLAINRRRDRRARRAYARVP